MPLMQKGVAMMSNRLPKVINPTAHAVIDYAVAATFFTMAFTFFKRGHKRAAVSSIVCGAAATANSIMTDYPGGLFKVISYHNHGRIDMGLGALTAALPNMMGLDTDAESRFFQGMAVAETAATAMTDFDAMDRTDYYRNARAA
jgi:hypothetical protein